MMRIFQRVSRIGLPLCFAAVVLCSLGDAAKHSANARDILDGRQVYTRASPSVVFILFAQKKAFVTGTGSIIRSDGYVLTNYHVISAALKKTERLRIYTRPQTVTGEPKKDLTHPHLVDIVAYSKKFDLALLRMKHPRKRIAGLPTLRLSEIENIGPGSRVYAIGHPAGGRFWTQTPGEIGAYSKNYGGKRGYHIYQHSAPVSSGNSGGPIVNAHGEQVGVNTFIKRARGLNFAATSRLAKDWVKSVRGPRFFDRQTVVEHDEAWTARPSDPKPRRSESNGFDRFLKRLKSDRSEFLRHGPESAEQDQLGQAESTKYDDDFKKFLRQIKKR